MGGDSFSGRRGHIPVFITVCCAPNAPFAVASAWQKKPHDRQRLRSRIRSDLIALGSFSFMAGSLAITATVLVRGDLLGWVYAATAVMSVAPSSLGAGYF